MGRSTHDEFFTKLAELFDSRKGQDHGKVFLTQKRLSHDQSLPAPTETAPFPDLSPGQPLPILMRATGAGGRAQRAAGTKVRLSTVVEPHELDAFYARYAEVCKAGMAALKPRDRTKRKGKAKTKRKGGGAVAGAGGPAAAAAAAS